MIFFCSELLAFFSGQKIQTSIKQKQVFLLLYNNYLKGRKKEVQENDLETWRGKYTDSQKGRWGEKVKKIRISRR